MMNTRQRNIGLLTGLIATFIPVFLIEASVLRYTNGTFIYPVDDTFIHLQIAKNLAHYNTWGINAHEFGSASSSPLYTLLLGLLAKMFLSTILVPFIVNSIAIIFLLLAINNWLARQQLSLFAVVLINVLVVFFAPLPILIMSGMEHGLQCLFSFLFLFYGCEWISKTHNAEISTKIPWTIPLYAILLTATRYEGLFLVAIVCLVFLYYKKINAAIITGIIALLPLILFGILSIAKGSYFLPNSILIKSNEVPLFNGGLTHFFQTLLVEKLTLSKPGITAMATQRLLIFLPAIYLLFRGQLKNNSVYTTLLIILTACTFLHLSLASTGKFYRYEAYLIMASILVTSTIVFKYYRTVFTNKFSLVSFASVFLFFFLLLPIVLRSTAAFSKAKRSCINIYQQQYQMGRFLREYYPSETIAANDIGAVGYYTNCQVVDLWGLGTIEVSRSRRNQYWNAAFLDSLCKQKKVRLAIIYDSWFQNAFEHRWQRIATWTIPDNVVCGDDTVSFYAVDPTLAAELKKNLQQYQVQLPAEVTVNYY